MIVGLGIDLFDVSRMERALCEGDAGFPHEIFTPDEISDCQARREPARHFAARFALKEAVAKALSLEDDRATPWREIEVRMGDDGAPSVALFGSLQVLADQRGVDRVIVSVAHAHGLAIAGAILESRHA